MKQTLCLTIVLLLLLTGSGALAEGGCWYYYKNGTHDFEQIEVQLPTCTADGYYVLECRQCGYSLREITGKATGHAWRRVKNESVAPTCTTAGCTTYVCEECGQIRTETLAALGHDMRDDSVVRSPTCEIEGRMTMYCTRCSFTGLRDIPRTDHQYGAWRVTIPATDCSSGTRQSACVECGATRSETFYPEGTLYRGMGGVREDVRALQQALIEMGLLDGQADGAFGRQTEAAVRAYQVRAQLTADGIAWPQTLTRLSSDLQALAGGTLPAAPARPGLSGTTQPSPETTVCRIFLDEQGNRRVQYCALHQVTANGAQALLEAAGAAHEQRAIEQVRALWQNELDLLYEEWRENASDEQQGAILASRSTFLTYLSLQEAALAGQEGELAASRRICTLIEEQCLTLCGLLHADGQLVGE